MTASEVAFIIVSVVIIAPLFAALAVLGSFSKEDFAVAVHRREGGHNPAGHFGFTDAGWRKFARSE